MRGPVRPVTWPGLWESCNSRGPGRVPMRLETTFLSRQAIFSSLASLAAAVLKSPRSLR